MVASHAIWRYNWTNIQNTLLKSTNTAVSCKRGVPEMNKNAMRGHKVLKGVDSERNVDSLDNDMSQLFKVSLSTWQSQRLHYCRKLFVLHLVMIAEREWEPSQCDNNLSTRQTRRITSTGYCFAKNNTDRTQYRSHSGRREQPSLTPFQFPPRDRRHKQS